MYEKFFSAAGGGCAFRAFGADGFQRLRQGSG